MSAKNEAPQAGRNRKDDALRLTDLIKNELLRKKIALNPKKEQSNNKAKQALHTKFRILPGMGEPNKPKLFTPLFWVLLPPW